MKISDLGCAGGCGFPTCHCQKPGHTGRLKRLAQHAHAIKPLSFQRFMAKLAALGARHPDAVRHFQAALAINPKNPMAIKRLDMLMALA